MPLLEKSDLRYDYNWKVSPGDNPKLVHEDSHHLSRREGYEMLLYLNGLGITDDNQTILYGEGKHITKEMRLYVEWMLNEHFVSTAPGRGTVTKWVNANWRPLKNKFKGLKPR